METTAAPIDESWNLSDIFSDDEAFRRAKLILEEALPALDRHRGTLGESATALADALDDVTLAARRFSALRCYSSLKSDADTRVATYQAMRQQVELLATALTGKIAYLRPEILTLAPESIEAAIQVEPRLGQHAHFLRDLMRQRAHVLSAPEERILAESGLVTRDASTLYQVLNNVELPRPEVTLASGEKVTLTPVGFHKHRATMHRADRLALFPKYFGAYAAFRDTFGQNVYAAVKAHVFRARTRGYASSLAAALSPENVPVSVYHNLVRQVRQNLPVLHRYFRIRARALGLERMEYSDLYCPLTTVGSPRRYSAEEARRCVIESQAPLGEEYGQPLQAAFAERWIDWHATPGKRSGAYATGWAYDAHPYVLVNFIGDYESVSTLSHEMGHAMHSYFSNRTQPFATADYSIFVAEVASTLNEALLNRHLLESADTAGDRLSLLASQLDGLRGTLFRQAMFAEFELEIHERVDRGEVLTGEILSEIYLGLLRAYHAHDEGVVHIADEYGVEWASIPHMYYDFYVYQYSTGIVAAHALAAALGRGPAAGQGDDARRRYLEFLSAGGSDYPLNVLRQAGVDLESAAPYDAAFEGMRQTLDALEQLLGFRG